MTKELKQAAIEYGGYGDTEKEAAFIAGARWYKKNMTKIPK